MTLGTLLLIEDDPLYGQVLSRRLRSKGFDVYHCDDADRALLMARHLVPSHLLVDMKLGQHSGLNLVAPLRQLLPRARIVLLTGYASIATAVEAMRQGADNYLAKPADTPTLLAALCDHLPTPDLPPPMNPRRLEWEHLQQTLRVNGGNVSATARQLGMHRRTLQRKLQKKPVAEPG